MTAKERAFLRKKFPKTYSLGEIAKQVIDIFHDHPRDIVGYRVSLVTPTVTIEISNGGPTKIVDNESIRV